MELVLRRVALVEMFHSLPVVHRVQSEMAVWPVLLAVMVVPVRAVISSFAVVLECLLAVSRCRLPPPQQAPVVD